MVRYLDQLERVARVLGGITVWEVFPDTPAEAAGLAFGDIVVSVSGTPTPTYGDFLKAGEVHLARLEFKVLRRGTWLRLCAEPCVAVEETRELTSEAYVFERRYASGSKPA